MTARRITDGGGLQKALRVVMMSRGAKLDHPMAGLVETFHDDLELGIDKAYIN
jgi:hypothetical protein